MNEQEINKDPVIADIATEGSSSREQGEPKNPGILSLTGFGFDQLERTAQEVQRLAVTSFKQTENGFRNVRGDVINIQGAEGIFRLSEISPSLREFHTFLATHSDSVLIRGSANKQEMILAIKEILEELQNRIID